MLTFPTLEFFPRFSQSLWELYCYYTAELYFLITSLLFDANAICCLLIQLLLPPHRCSTTPPSSEKFDSAGGAGSTLRTTCVLGVLCSNTRSRNDAQRHLWSRRRGQSTVKPTCLTTMQSFFSDIHIIWNKDIGTVELLRLTALGFFSCSRREKSFFFCQLFFTY